ncbi:MAG: hypothetical protein QOJ82_3429 [Solirubrobacteraceae bacterium]|jgi:hypothetical protein|nr:hypothetical protein [Solirubrobacteraceae bacterium]
MRRLLERWPPVLWIALYVASLLILMGGTSTWTVLAVGATLSLAACATALHLALRRRPDRPRPGWFAWAIGGVALFYVVCAAVATATMGVVYGVAALMAGVIPMTAVALLLATARAKTATTEEGVRDASVEDHRDPFPGIGIDGATAEQPRARRRART